MYLLTQVDMEFPMTAATLSYLESASFEPLPFPRAGDMNVMGRVIHQIIPLEIMVTLESGRCTNAIIRQHSSVRVGAK